MQQHLKWSLRRKYNYSCTATLNNDELFFKKETHSRPLLLAEAFLWKSNTTKYQ